MNRAPSAVGKIPDQVVAVDSAVVVDVQPYFADPDGDTLAYAASSSGTATVAVTVSGSMVTVTGVAAGGATVTVTARDPEGLTAEQVFGVTVPNRAPAAVGTIADQEAYVDSTATVDVAEHFTDPDGDPLEYSATSSDTTRATVVVSGSTVAVNGTAVGSATVTVTARDTAGLAAEQRFEVTVPNRTPEAVGTIADREVEVDSVVMVDVATYFTDPDRDSLEYSASSSDTTRATVEVSGSMLTVTGVAAGSTAVTVTSRDPGRLSAEQRFGVKVPNRAPLAVGTIPDQAVHVDDTVAVDLAEFFADPDGDVLEYAAASSDSTRAAVSVSGSMATISGAAVGSTTVAVTARDTAGLAAEQRFRVTVPNRAPVAVGTIEDQEVHVSDTVVVDVASYFTDADREELGYAAGASSEATVSVAVSGSTVTIAGMSVGNATVTVTAEDPGGLRAEQVFGVTVPNRAPVAVGTIAGREVEVDSVATLDVARYFTDPDGQALGYSATSSEPTRATVTVSGSTITVTGVAAGRTTVTVRAEDPGGLWARQSFEVLVPNRAPVAAGTIEGQEVYVGDAVALDVAGYFTDPDGDTLTYAAASSDVTRASVSMSGSTVTVRGLAVGDATVTVTARDPEGLAAEQRLVVTVPNRAPEAVGTIGDQDIHVGDRVVVDVAGHFTDPDGQELVYAAGSSSPAMAVVSVSGSTVTIAGMGVGGATVTVTAQDPGGLMTEQRFRVTVPNRAPEAVGTIANREVAVDRVVTLSVAAYFRDPDGEALEYSAVSSDPTRATVLASGSTLTLAGVAKGTAAVTVTAKDPGGLATEQRFRVTVPNRAPVAVGTILDQEVHVGDTVVVDVAPRFADPDGDPLEYAIASSDTTRVAVSGSGSVVVVWGAAVGSGTVTVTVRDPEGLVAEQRFAVLVPNRAPEAVDTIADQVVHVGDTLVVDVAGYFTDPDGEELVYTAVSSSTTTATAEVSGSVVTAAGVAVGTLTVTVTARDPGGLSAEQRFRVAVPNRAPETVGTIADQAVDVDSVVAFDVAEYFADPDGETLEYSAASSDTTTATVAVSGSLVTLEGMAAGTALVTVTARDPGDLVAEQAFELTVPSRPPVPVGTIADRVVEAGSPVTVDVVAYFTDPDGDTLQYGATSSNASRVAVSASGSVVAVRGVAGGSAIVTVTARDPEELTATQTFEVTVPNQAPEAVGEIGDMVVELNSSVSLDVSPYFTDPDGDELTYDATSSRTSRAKVSIVGAMVAVTGEGEGTATITVTARDPDGLTARQRFDVTVLESNQVPEPVGTIPDRTIEAGEEFSVDVEPYFTDPDGDELVYSAASSNEAIATVELVDSRLDVKGHDVGEATITVTATDTGGLTATQKFDVEVQDQPNRAPEPVGTIPDRTVEAGEEFSVDVEPYFTDPDGDELVYSAASSNEAIATVELVDSRLDVKGHDVGEATITVTATDTGGLTATQKFDVEVEDQPNRAPEPVGTIPDRTVEAGEEFSVDVEPYFTDPDGDDLEYTAASSNEAIATVKLAGSRLEVEGHDVGEATITVTATDPGGLTATQQFDVEVEDQPNRAPEPVGTIPDRTVEAGEEFSVDVEPYFTDPDGDDLVYSAASSNEAIATVELAGSRLEVEGHDVGEATITVTATDPGGLTATQKFDVEVEDQPNRAPEPVGTIPDRTVEAGEEFSVDVEPYFTDPDGDDLVYSAASSNEAIATVGVAGSRLEVEGHDVGEATITVTATDPGGLTATQKFDVEVEDQPNRAPEPVGTIPDQTIETGKEFSVDVEPYFTDPDGDDLVYSAASSNEAIATVELAGSRLEVEGHDVGEATITVTATDPGGLTATQKFDVEVEDQPNRAPEPVGTIPDRTVEAGEEFSVDVEPYFTDPDGDDLEYTAASSNEAIATVELAGSRLEVEGHDVGEATITVTATDPGGLTATQKFDVEVEDQPNRAPEPVGTIPDQTIETGKEFSVDVEPYFTDPDGDDLVYSAASSNEAIATVELAGSRLEVEGHDVGEATITVTATDTGGLTATQKFDVEVEDQPNRAPEPVGTIPNQTIETGKEFSVDVEPYFTDPDGDDLVYSAASSNEAIATVELVDSSLDVKGHDVGEAIITVTATDPGGLTATQQFDVEVEDQPNRAPEPVGTIPDRTVEAGEEFSVDVEPYFTDPDGDDLVYSAASSNEAIATVELAGSSLDVKGHDAGEATITVTATDTGGLTATQKFDVEVQDPPNRAPYVADEIGDLLNAIPGERYRSLLTDVFVDPDGDSLDYTASSSDTGVAEAEVAGDTIFVTAVDVGTATVTVTATDPGDLFATDEFEVTVVAIRFDLWLGFTPQVTETQRLLIRQARARWESILRDTELNDVEVPDTVTCLGIRAIDVGEVDDHLVLIDVDEDDGVGGTLARANYCYVRSTDGSPIVSAVVFDEADIGTLLARGSMGDVTFHEMAHGLGFLSKYWDYKDLLEDGDDPHFKGELAIEAFDDAGGEDYEDEKVPISPDYSHWRKSVFGREGMTPTLTLGVKNPFSAITLQAMADVDYEVDESLADDYELPGTAPPPGPPGESGRVLDLSNDVARTPVMVLGPGGRIVRVIQPPPGRPDLTAFRRWREARLEPSLRRVRPDEVVRWEAPERKTVWRLVR